jgi:anti-anti-sigma factor
VRDRIAGFQVAEAGDVIVAAIEGEIDGSNAAELRLALSDRLPSASRGLVLDLTKVKYLDSAGIHLLFDLGRRLAARRQSLRLVMSATSPIRRVLELSAIQSVAPIHAGVDEALVALADSAPEVAGSVDGGPAMGLDR